MIEKYPELKYQYEHGPKNQSSENKSSESQWRYALFNCLVDEDGCYLSEDYSFCRRWTDIGGEIWIDLQSRLTHVGSFQFDGDFSTQSACRPIRKGTRSANNVSRPGAEREAPFCVRLSSCGPVS